MITPTYTEVLMLVERMPSEDQQRLLAELAARVRQPHMPKHNVTEFRGVAGDNKIGMDAQEYVNQERDSWNG